MMADELLNAQDLITAKKHDTFHSEVITGKTGGLSTGANIDYATNAVTGQVQDTLPHVLSKVGFVPAGFDFTTGGTVTMRNQAVYFATDGNWYSWGGVLPKVVAPASTPTGSGGISPSTWNVSTSAFMYRDWQGFTDALLAEAGIVDDGQPDTVGDSQRVDAIKAICGVNLDTVDAMVSANLNVGDYVTTKGYYVAGDGGGNVYEIIASGSPIDGGLYIAVKNGVAKGTFPTGCRVSQYGIADDGSDHSQKFYSAILNHDEIDVDKSFIAAGVEIRSGVIIHSKNGSKITSASGAASNIIIGSSLSGFKIKGLKFAAQATKAAGTNAGNCVYLSNCSQFYISECDFDIGGNSGIVADSCYDCSVSKNTFTQSAFAVDAPVGDFSAGQKAAVGFFHSSSNYSITKNRFKNVGTGVIVQTYDIPSAAKLGEVSGNIISDCATYGIVAYVQSPTTQSIDGLVISGNMIDTVYGSTDNSATLNKSFGAGIYSLNCKNVVISENIISKTNIKTNGESLTPAGIAIAEARGYISVVGNSVSGAAWYGVAAFTCKYSGSHVSISCNDITSEKAAAYSKGSSNVLICANTVNSKLAGISVRDDGTQCKSATVTNNNVVDAGSQGILFLNVDNVTCSNNSIAGYDNFGIQIQGVSSGTVASNVIEGPSVGIALVTASGIAVSANTINVSSGDAFRSVTSTSNCLFSGNTLVTSKVINNQGGTKVRQTYAGGVASGSYLSVGDIIENTTIAPNGFIGSVCTTAGQPGVSLVMKNFGQISA